jgi:hypothetical protein
VVEVALDAFAMPDQPVLVATVAPEVEFQFNGFLPPCSALLSMYLFKASLAALGL